MISNYLKIALRNLQKNRLYSFINIAGLAVGISCCLLISIFIWNELSYDRHHEAGDRIYRINSEVGFNNNHMKLAVVSAPLAEAVQNEFSEVESVTRFRKKGSFLIKRDKENFKENEVVFADPTVFNVFTIPFQSGDPVSALNEPNTMVISNHLAEKLFPDEDAVNQTLILDNEQIYKVTGVFEDMPLNNHFHFNAILSMKGLEEAKSSNWLSNNFNTYVKLREGVSPEQFQGKLDLLIDKYISPQIQQILGHSMEQFRASGNTYEFGIQPLHDIHLYSDRIAELEGNGSITYVYLFAAIALFILVIACINFMNLSTARSASRAKEVGIRKVLGSFKSALIKQFLAESILLSLIAYLIALGITQLAIPFFNDLAGKTLELPIHSMAFWAIFIAAILLTGFLAGVYPAFFLSSFKPARVLKSNKSKAGNSAFIRSTLVVFQFCISIILIIGTLTVYNQLNYIQEKNLGFNRDQVIIIKDVYGLDNLQTFKNEVLQISAVKSGTVTSFLPAGGASRTDMTFWEEGLEPSEDNMVSTQIWNVDHDYIPTLQMELVEGRNFNEDMQTDSMAIIINEAAVKAFYLDKPLESSIQTFAYNYETGQIERDKLEKYKIVGVVKNFHFQSLKDEVKPLALRVRPSNSLMAFRFEAEKTGEVISAIEQKWQQMAGGQPFLYSFMDDDYENIYKAEVRLGQIFTVFAVLAIFIGCLGLFALSSFTAEQRIKEIGVRKVLGASVTSIVLLFTKDLSRLVIIAFILAVPFAWYFIDQWLQNYSYRTDVNVWIYIGAGVATLLIAFLTMSYQSIRAALTNPVDSLNNE
ncbi:MAG: ABC transporter permease [Candidatus Cyclobacteriaceae bacterium M2_1C_046]